MSVCDFRRIFFRSLLLLWAEPLLKYPEPFIKDVLNYSGFGAFGGITYWLRLTGLPEFGVVNFFHLPFLELPRHYDVEAGLIIAAVLLLGWRRRALGGKGLWLNTLAYAWIIFCISRRPRAHNT